MKLITNHNSDQFKLWQSTYTTFKVPVSNNIMVLGVGVFNVQNKYWLAFINITEKQECEQYVIVKDILCFFGRYTSYK